MPLLFERLGAHDGTLRQQFRKRHSLFFRLPEALMCGTRRLHLPPPCAAVVELGHKRHACLSLSLVSLLICKALEALEGDLLQVGYHVVRLRGHHFAHPKLAGLLCCCFMSLSARLVHESRPRRPPGQSPRSLCKLPSHGHSILPCLRKVRAPGPWRAGDAASLRAPVIAAETPVRTLASHRSFGV